LISRVVPGYESITQVGHRNGGEFHISGRTFHEPRFATSTGKAVVHDVEPKERPIPTEDELRLMTVRSEGQFNTVVYEEEDLYRGQDRRDVILMHADDMTRLGFEESQLVEVATATGSLKVHPRPIDIRKGNAVMYYPEANMLVPRHVDEASRTPAFKGIMVRVSKATST
jgi:anaerobic selenocysteine-containing dehydrogenase